MTDLPQHEAIVSIMRHLHDPTYGFQKYYAWALERTLYWFPYVLAVALAWVFPINFAVHVTVFIAVLAYPVGLLMMLRALRRPPWLALLAVPILYHRGFFWGFVHFGLGVGLAFMALGLLMSPWSRYRGPQVGAICLLIAVTHVYGLLIIGTYAVGWLIAGDRKPLVRGLVWVAPAALTLVLWGVFAAQAPGYGPTEWVDFNTRLEQLPHQVLGGYVDDTEVYVLSGWLLLIVALSFGSLPITWGRLKRLSVHSRAAYLFVIANGVAYFTLPMATPTAKFIHFRHAVLAAMMLPLIIDLPLKPWLRQWGVTATAALAAYAGANAWQHLRAFNAEARDFDQILEWIPQRSHIAQLTYDSKGKLLRSHAYLHFGAYAQAEKGGVIAVSFPILFWNIPLKGRPDSGMPSTPKNMEWAPSRFSERRLGPFYDTLLVRETIEHSRRFHSYAGHHLQLSAGQWQIYRADGSP